MNLTFLYSFIKTFIQNSTIQVFYVKQMIRRNTLYLLINIKMNIKN